MIYRTLDVKDDHDIRKCKKAFYFLDLNYLIRFTKLGRLFNASESSL